MTHQSKFGFGDMVKHILVKNISGIVESVIFFPGGYIEYNITWEDGTTGIYSELVIVEEKNKKNKVMGFVANIADKITGDKT